MFKTLCVTPCHLYTPLISNTHSLSKLAVSLSSAGSPSAYVRLQVHLECHAESGCLSPARAATSPAPCSPSPAGTVQCRAPALTPRAAYGKAIRASVPLKRGTDRNTTAQNTMPCLPFPPARFSFFFLFPSKRFQQDPVLLSAFSIYFPSSSLPGLSHPLSLLIHLTLTCLCSALTFCLSAFLLQHS